MNIRVQYIDSSNRQAKIDQFSNYIFIGEEILIEGNFLNFSDVKPIDTQFRDLSNTTNMILLKQEGII